MKKQTDQIIINRTAVESPNIKSVGYDPSTKTLEVEFTHGAVYRFSGVPAETYEGMLKAESVWKFYAARVSDLFESARFFPKGPGRRRWR